jgi:hypothetical protein
VGETGWAEMPRKIRQLIAELEAWGFVNRGGKGSHRNFVIRASSSRSRFQETRAMTRRGIWKKR